MPSQQIDRLRAGIEAFNRTGELNVGLLDPDFEIEQASSIIDTAGVFVGRDAVHRSLDELGESFEDLSFEAEQFFGTSDGRVLVMVRARGRGRGSGVEIDNHIAWLWTFREGKAVRLVVYEEPDEALEAVGPKEVGKSPSHVGVLAALPGARNHRANAWVRKLRLGPFPPCVRVGRGVLA